MKFYITTPLYYVNDVPHIGHAYTNIAADTLARYRRLKGDSVFFLTGTDEHGQKIERQARELKITPEQLADTMVERFKILWQQLNISYDYFIRTTQPEHVNAVKNFFEKLREKKLIYRGKYEGYYCVPCETFIPKTQLLLEKFCPGCNREVEWLSQESYFFKLSQYKEALINHFDCFRDFIQPQSRMNEVRNIIEANLHDLSISRRDISWGIEIDKDEVIYVWFDALINYISACGYPDIGLLERYWPADVHIIGKDILRFHGIIWPAMLLAIDLALPKCIFAHGWWTIEGEKMSKSKGNVVEPQQIIEKVGVDGLRYFLLREVPFGEDGDFSFSSLRLRLNSDLANNLGNLVNRTVALVKHHYNLKIPQPDDIENPLLDYAIALPAKVDKVMEQLKFHEALKNIFELVDQCNVYLDRSAPWSKQKDSSAVLYNVLEALRFIGVLLGPFVPTLAKKILDQLNVGENLSTLKSLESWGGLQPQTYIKLAPPLFNRV